MCVNTVFEFTHKICSELVRFYMQFLSSQFYNS